MICINVVSAILFQTSHLSFSCTWWYCFKGGFASLRSFRLVCIHSLQKHTTFLSNLAPFLPIVQTWATLDMVMSDPCLGGWWNGCQVWMECCVLHQRVYVDKHLIPQRGKTFLNIINNTGKRCRDVWNKIALTAFTPTFQLSPLEKPSSFLFFFRS